MTSRNPLLLESRIIHQQKIDAILSEDFDDPTWDNFLRGISLGQFQQSSPWAQSKRSEGWQCLRVTLKHDDTLFGGFQILWKKTRAGRLGYVSKGPVLMLNAKELQTFALDALVAVTRLHRLVAIIAQPPDDDPGLAEVMKEHGFAANDLVSVIDASLWVDLSGPSGEWESKLRADRRTEIRSALRHGTEIRKADETDLPMFFELMQSSCRR
ncbi:MAG: lipid II:glycine glycyltransferase FemX, partial [Limisphaerales bacterium]